MNMVEDSSLVSGRQGATLTAVILLHIAVGFVFYTELASHFHKKLDPAPLNLTRVDQILEVIKAPSDVPLIDLLKFYVPRTEAPIAPPIDPNVDVTGDVAPPVAPQTTPQLPPHFSVITKVRMDPKHPLRIGKEYYPDAAIRSNEMGRCVVQVTVAIDGRITAATIQSRSGFERLDQACLSAVRGQRMLPATEDGKPIESTISIPILWNLSDR